MSVPPIVHTPYQCPPPDFYPQHQPSYTWPPPQHPPFAWPPVPEETFTPLLAPGPRSLESHQHPPSTQAQPQSSPSANLFATPALTQSRAERGQLADPAAPHLEEYRKKGWKDQALPPPPPKLYESREELLKGARQWARDHNYKLVIAHSTSGNDGKPNKLWLKCELWGEYRIKHNLTEGERKRNRKSMKIGCPMKFCGTRYRFEEGGKWLLTIRNPEHNHGPVVNEHKLLKAFEWADLEAILFQWQQTETANKPEKKIHGNTIRAKALELWNRMPQYHGMEAPDFSTAWLNEYRQRHGMKVRPSGRPKVLEKGAVLVEEVVGDQHPVPATVTSGAQEAVRHDQKRRVIDSTDLLALFPTIATQYLHLPRGLFDSTASFVRNHMNTNCDPSHDFAHVIRVVKLAAHIFSIETAQNAIPPSTSAPAVLLAALCHDIGDSKYVHKDASSSSDSGGSPGIASLLLDLGADDLLALKVEVIANNVSWSKEQKAPRLVQAVLSQHPELAIVQDADRLDALGAIGLGRTFAYGAAKWERDNSKTKDGVSPTNSAVHAGSRGYGLDETIAHTEIKLDSLEQAMKTQTARLLAKKRSDKIKAFRTWWEEEEKLEA